ncbi:cytochrome P450 [Nannocystis radixulma]|uniref:Cytochrome P450 n=1 Tax=Nannocystis radixulma TaxID=2995305 RepID=A0ABT5AZ98_9BACT|nr:cytochrome P450 [Nannocystis radixulma]MDC0667155.1 cytochrome P450 [Nannocystis radixulma]
MADSDACPFLDLHGPAFLADPHAALRAAREQHWYAETAMGPAVLRFQEVQAVLSRRTLRSGGPDSLAIQGITEGPLAELMASFLLNSEGSTHDRLRRLVGRSFTMRRVETLRPLITGIAHALIDEIAARGRCDLVAAFADPFARSVLCAFVGFPPDAQAKVRRWTGDIALLFGLGVAEHRARIEASLGELHEYVDDLVAARRRAPGDDLVSDLVTTEAASDALSQAELRAMIITFLVAGSDPVLHQFGHAFATFLAHPEQWRLLAEAPDLAGQAAEEIVRFSPASLIGLPRVATDDVEIGGHVFPCGSFVLPVLGAANRDPRVFVEPDRFDITSRRRPHLTFGGGIHHCLGAALARVELQIALPLLARRLGEFTADGPAVWLPPTQAVYGPVQFPVAYHAPAA